MIRIMKRILKSIIPPPAPPAGCNDKERIDREVVRRRSHGNIYLQKGKYYIDKDVSRQYERVKRFDFSDVEGR